MNYKDRAVISLVRYHREGTGDKDQCSIRRELGREFFDDRI